MAKTYKFLAEYISDTYYKLKASDDRNYSLPYFGEAIAQEVAFFAKASAFENSAQGESLYANNQFITVYKNVPIVKENGELYSNFPATPAGLPNNREIVEITIDGNNCFDVVPKKNQASFAQKLLNYDLPFVTYKIENGKFIYETNNPLFTEGTATVKMIAGVGENLLNSPLNIPKDVESNIITKILARLLPMKAIPLDLINDAVPNPS